MNHRPITLKFFEGVDGANQFDLCDVVPCDRFQKKHISICALLLIMKTMLGV